MRNGLLLLGALPILTLLATWAPSKAGQETAAVPWRTDYNTAREEANRLHKPLFVLFRCPNRKEESVIDTEVLRPTNPELIRLLAQRYIPVRLTSLKGVDLNTFRFDYDLTLVGLVLDGRDQTILAHSGMRSGALPNERLTLPGLKGMLARAADTYNTRKAGGSQAQKTITLAEKFPSFAQTKRAQEACYHCHYAYDAEIAARRASGTFRKADLYRYPLPENLGITLDRDIGNTIREILPNSPAAKIGLQPGDRIERAGGTSVYTAGDLQWALDPIPTPGTIPLDVVSPGKPIRTLQLSLPTGWRKADISWRPSQGAVPPILGIWEEPLDASAKRTLGIPEDRMALRVSFLFAGAKWEPTRGDLKKDDIIIAVGGVALPSMTPRQFHSYVRMNYEVGGEIPLTILRDGKRMELRLRAVDVGLEG